MPGKFQPRYRITDLLLANIKRINLLVIELNQRRFPNVVIMELEKSAREISTHASISIEGNPLPLTEVKKILKNRPKQLRSSEQEVVNYNEALSWLNEKLNKEKINISADLILKIQKKVMKKLLPDFEIGRFRQKPVVVNDPRTRKTVYLPPDYQPVPGLMSQLVDFINQNQNQIDPLILAGILHKQMVIIHPFMDGNGRTTRLATKVLLAAMGLNTFQLFSFENYYNQNVTKYFATVGEYGNYYELKNKIDFTGWLEYFTGGIIDELLRVQKILPQIATSPATNLEPYHQKILEFIKDKGFITDRDYSRLTDRAKATRVNDFQKLIDLGLIERQGKGKATFYRLAKIR